MFSAATSTGALRRALLSAAALAAALGVLFGGAGGANATSLSVVPTTTAATVSPSSATVGQHVEFDATVTAAAGTAPTGYVEFDAYFTPAGTTATQAMVIGTAPLTPGSGSQSTATFGTNVLAAGTYQVTGTFTSASTTWQTSTSPSSGLTIASISLASTTMNFTASASTFTAGQSVGFSTAFTSAPGQPSPTGQVIFTAGPDVTTQSPIGTATIANGVATLANVGGWSGGSYLVEAQYQGDSLYAPASAHLSLTVNAAPDQAVATTTTVTLSPSSVSAGGLVTITAHVAQSGSTTPPPGGDQVVFRAGPTGGDPGARVLTSPSTAYLDASGNARVVVGGWSPGSYTIEADYVGDVFDKASTGTATLTVSNAAFGTGLAYTGDVQAYWRSSALLSGRLTDAQGNPVSGQMLTLSIGNQAGDACTSLTDANGNGSCSITVGELPGQYTVSATYSGNETYRPSGISTLFNVLAVPTRLTYTGATSGGLGQVVTLSAHLVNTVTGAPIAGEPVALTMDSQACAAAPTTNASGDASCSITVHDAVGAYPINASFAGDGGYVASADNGTFTVPRLATSLATTSVQVLAGDQAALSATLTAGGSPVPNETVVLSTGAGQSCSATTGSDGVASCSVAPAQSPGTYPGGVSASFAGDGAYLPSGASALLTVVSPQTTTVAAPVAPVLAGTAATLSATVTPAAATGSVTFSSGGTTLCTATLSGGAASCAASFAQTGSYVVTARYGGGGVYPSSSGTTTVLVYAFAPGGGAFVVGDRSATGSVTFWGAQWAKVNVLSGGAAPDGFKGFAINGAVCGGTWSTDPGNSAPPPAGPLPAYMAVVVAGKSTKSGSQISGTAVSVVIVKTDAGYDANPGHAGTGTVVATLCSG